MDIYFPLLTDIINDSLKRGKSPYLLKLAEVIRLLKNPDLCDKANYRPISLLSYISKVFETVIYNQLNEYIEPFLSEVLDNWIS